MFSNITLTEQNEIIKPIKKVKHKNGLISVKCHNHEDVKGTQGYFTRSLEMSTRLCCIQLGNQD